MQSAFVRQSTHWCWVSSHTRRSQSPVVATTLLRHRIVEDFTYDKGLKLGMVSEQIGLVLRRVAGKLRLAFAATAKAVCGALRPRPCSIVSGLAMDLLRSRAELAVENVLLRRRSCCVVRPSPSLVATAGTGKRTRTTALCENTAHPKERIRAGLPIAYSDPKEEHVSLFGCDNSNAAVPARRCRTTQRFLGATTAAGKARAGGAVHRPIRRGLRAEGRIARRCPIHCVRRPGPHHQVFECQHSRMEGNMTATRTRRSSTFPESHGGGALVA